MRLILRLVLLHCPLFLLVSCKKYKSSDAAFFIRAKNVIVAANPLTQGSGSHKITDLWLYSNGQFVGAYPVGNVMPVPLYNGHARITVFAGIKNNSLSETRIPWQFYQRFDLDTAVESGTTIDRSFAFNYNSATVFSLIESFDQAGFKIVKSPISEVSFTTTAAGSPDSFEGKSMLLDLTSSTYSIAQVETNVAQTLPLATGNVYLELNYKCNSEFSIGVFGDNQTIRPVITLRPISSWNKVYISLADVINQSPTSTSYKVYFRMLRTSGSDPDPQLFMDNIKIVYIP